MDTPRAGGLRFERVMEMEHVLEASVATAPVIAHPVTAVSVVQNTQEKRSPKFRLRLRFAAVFMLLLIFAPTFAAMLWMYLQHRY